MTKLPPYSEEAERAVIGSILLDPERVIDLCVNGHITTESFYVPSHRVIFDALVLMREKGRAIDLLTACQRLKDDGLLEQAGGVSNIEQIVESTPTSAHAEYYIDIIRDKFLKRCLINRCTESIDSCYYGEDNAEKILSGSIASLLDVSEYEKKKSNEEIFKESIGKWEIAQKGGLAGIGSPWPRFNERFGGLRNGAVTVFAGKAGTGKSSAAATWLHYLGTKGIPVASCPFEDGAERTYQRIAGIHGDFSAFKLDVGNSTAADIDLASGALRSVLRMPIYLEDRSMNIDQIISFAISEKAKHGIKVFMLDAFKDIHRSSRDVESDDHHSIALCALAKRLDIPVLVFHHVRKQDPREPNLGRIKPDDIRGSGQIYSDCRCLILLQAYLDKGSGEVKYEFEIAKSNYGPTGVVPMVRISNRCKWEEAPPIITNAEGQHVSEYSRKSA